MTAPYASAGGYSNITDVPLDDIAAANKPDAPVGDDPSLPYPPAMLPLSEEQDTALRIWLDQWIADLTVAQAEKQAIWARIEQAYRAEQGPPTERPFIGCSRDTLPVIAMAVEPVHARMETGIFKQDPVYRAKPLRKSAKKYADSVEKWYNFYMRTVVDFQKVAGPRLLESAKLGTMAFKVPYVYEKCHYKMYDDQNKIVDYEKVSFRGPKPEGVSIGDLLFPPGYQDVQDCPILAERQRTTIGALRKLEYSGYLTGVDKLERFGTHDRTDVEDVRESVSHHTSLSTRREDIVVHEVWFQYQFDTTKPPICYVATYHTQSRTLLQLRLNPYIHQKYPYVVIPYGVSNESLYGVGIGEMTLPFQDSLTSYHRMSMDNAYLANSRMFRAKRNAPGIGENITVYAGKVFFLDNPEQDLLPLELGDVYPSTLEHQRNLFGLVEKRTGVSDYLTGRESPVIGSRATATSTLALIQEGTRRVEQVMENVRRGFNEVAKFCMILWVQYGLGDIEDYIFGDEDTGPLLDEFFKSVVRPENLDTLMVLDVSVTDATTNRQVQQQMQLSLVQIVTQYMGQLIQVGQTAIQAQAQMPQLTELIAAVVKAANTMYRDLVSRYDIPNAEDYLPDVLAYIQGPAGGSGGAPVGPGQLPGQPPVAGIPGVLPFPGGPGGPPASGAIGVPRTTPAVPGPGGGF